MHVFISAYVFLALASWSALAAPFSGSERHNGNVAAQEDSSSSSNLMSRQVLPMEIGPVVTPQTVDDSTTSTMDCDSEKKDKKKDSQYTGASFPAGVELTPVASSVKTSTGPAPAVARRHFRSPMRRSGGDSPNIFDRDDAPNTAAALAAPFYGSERNNENAAARDDSSSSSILMSRQDIPMGIGPVVTPQVLNDDSTKSTMDCDSKDKDKDKKKDSEKTVYGVPISELNLTPTSSSATTSTGPAPAVARRHFRSPMRRSGRDSPNIFERDDAPTTAASGNPITVADVLRNYLQQRAASRKRAMSPKTSRGYD